MIPKVTSYNPVIILRNALTRYKGIKQEAQKAREELKAIGLQMLKQALEHFDKEFEGKTISLSEATQKAKEDPNFTFLEVDLNKGEAYPSNLKPYTVLCIKSKNNDMRKIQSSRHFLKIQGKLTYQEK